jgi:hypothetical protein
MFPVAGSNEVSAGTMSQSAGKSIVVKRPIVIKNGMKSIVIVKNVGMNIAGKNGNPPIFSSGQK